MIWGALFKLIVRMMLDLILHNIDYRIIGYSLKADPISGIGLCLDQEQPDVPPQVLHFMHYNISLGGFFRLRCSTNNLLNESTFK
jgi:hypothetical protein